MDGKNQILERFCLRWFSREKRFLEKSGFGKESGFLGKEEYKILKVFFLDCSTSQAKWRTKLEPS